MKRSLTLLALLFATLAVTAQWTQKQSMYDYGRSNAVSCFANGRCYAGLGELPDGSYSSDFWQFDTLANRWTRLPDYPGSGLYESSCFVIQGMVYVGLGFSEAHACAADLWRFNPGPGLWTRMADFPDLPRYGAETFVIGDSAFVVGGSHNDGFNYHTEMYMYSPATGTWKQKAPFPGGKRSVGTAFALGGYGYFGMGNSNSYASQSDLWRYDPVADAWSQVASFPGTERCGAVCFTSAGREMVGFGCDAEEVGIYSDAYVYNPNEDSWQVLNPLVSLPGRAHAMSFSTGISGFVAGGFDLQGKFTDLWELPGSLMLSVDDAPEALSPAIRLYPNPAGRFVTISRNAAGTARYHLSLSALDGKIILSDQVSMAESYRLELPALPKGIYLLRLSSETEDFSGKVVIE